MDNIPQSVFWKDQMLRLIMDNIPQSVFWKDRSSVYMGCNLNFAKNAGFDSPDEIVGKTDYDLPWAHEEASWYRKVDQRVMQNDRAEYHIMETQLQATGSRAWVDTNKVPLHDDEGRVVGVLGTFEDITERKRTHEALQRAHDELERRVEERTAELCAANTQLQMEINERRQVEATEHEQRTLAEALRDTAALLNSTLNLDQVLNRILSAIGRVVPHDTASIALVDADQVGGVRYRGRGRDSRSHSAGRWYTIDTSPALRQMAETRQSLIVEDCRTAPDWVDLSPRHRARSYLGTPIQVEGEVIGFINLNGKTPGFFNAQHAERLRAFADQAAIAIQNARLYQRAQTVAALEERQRLARDLHDAVSQTLGSVSLMADVLPTVWLQDREEGLRVLGRIREQTRGALAEMRMLLLELRPSALVEARLDDLMRHLAAAAMSHKKLQVSISAAGRSSLPADVQIAIYRIAQETFHNVCKHSRATRASVSLRCARGRVELRIRDNGRGFHHDRLTAEHLGLGIMRERAESIHARLRIESRIGRGTCVTLVWPGDQPRQPRRRRK